MKLLLSRFIQDPSRAYAGIIRSRKQLAFGHSHDYFEFFMVNSGTAVHRINGASRELVKGSVVLLRPNDYHYYSDMSPDFEIINMLIPSETIHALFEYLGAAFDSRRFTSTRYPPASELPPAVFKALVAELEKLVLSKRLLKERSDAFFRITLMNVLVACFPIGPPGGHIDLPVWLRWLALQMMKPENFSEGVKAMQRLSGRSAEHLSRSWRKHLRCSPTEFINELRLEHTARAILETEEKIIDICYEAGFRSLSHYYHLFKRKFGVAPNEFRKRAGADRLDESLFSSAILDMGIPPAKALEATGGMGQSGPAAGGGGRS